MKTEEISGWIRDEIMSMTERCKTRYLISLVTKELTAGTDSTSQAPRLKVTIAVSDINPLEEDSEEYRQRLLHSERLIEDAVAKFPGWAFLPNNGTGIEIKTLNTTSVHTFSIYYK